MFEALRSLTSLPNLHPAVVHFPVALLLTAVSFDVACLFLRRELWLDRAAAALYILGTLAAGGAALAGRQAEDSLRSVPAGAQSLIAEHSDWAFFTVVAFSGISLLRLEIAWRDRRQSQIRPQPIRLLGLVAGFGGLWLLFQTADRGGALVYRYGVAVEAAKAEPSAPRGQGRSGKESAGTPESRLARRPDGAVIWVPLPGDAAALGDVLRPVEQTSPAAVAAGSSDEAKEGSDETDEGLALTVSGRVLMVLPGKFDDVQVEAKLDLAGFTGTAGVAHHVRNGASAGLFTLSTDGKAVLVHLTGGAQKVLDDGSFELPSRPVVLSVSSAGSHLKGLVDEAVVVHGHMSPGPAGAAGLLLDGQGVVRVLSMRAIPLKRPVSPAN